MPLSVPLAACMPMLTDTVELSAVSRTRGRTVTAPCRVGTAGALYDRVSGNLFYSATATPLVAGPDKT